MVRHSTIGRCSSDASMLGPGPTLQGKKGAIGRGCVPIKEIVGYMMVDVHENV